MRNSLFNSLSIAVRLPFRVSYKCLFAHITVTVLTVVLFSGCSTLHLQQREECKSHAHIRIPLDEFINQRFPTGIPVRLGIIPFATPVNLAAQSDRQPGAGKQIARYLQRELLSKQTSVNVIETMDRSDWPGQAEQFFHGNFNAISMARDAGFDLVLVGVIENPRSAEAISAFSKLIEVESGITVWSGRSEASTNANVRSRSGVSSWWTSDQQRYPRTNTLLETLAQCLITNALTDQPVPE